AEKVVVQANADAEARIAQAKAEAEAIRLRGEAEAAALQAKATALRDNPSYVALTAAEKWDGKLPQTMVPGSAVPFVTVPRGAGVKSLGGTRPCKGGRVDRGEPLPAARRMRPRAQE